MLTKTIALVKEPADLVVTVLHNNKTLEGANVELFCHNPPVQMEYVLQDNGDYVFERSLPTLPPGECTLKVTKKG